MTHEQRIERLAEWLNKYEREGGLEVPTWDSCDQVMKNDYKDSADLLYTFLSTLGCVWLAKDDYPTNRDVLANIVLHGVEGSGAAYCGGTDLYDSQVDTKKYQRIADRIHEAGFRKVEVEHGTEPT